MLYSIIRSVSKNNTHRIEGHFQIFKYELIGTKESLAVSRKVPSGKMHLNQDRLYVRITPVRSSQPIGSENMIFGN